MDFFVYNFQQFLLIFSRIMGIVMTATVFSSNSFPTTAKLGFSFFVTIVIFPMVYKMLPPVPPDVINYALTALGEGMIGAVLGLFITIAFSVFQLAGQFFTVQMGFGASEVFDPMSQISLPLMGQYLYFIFVLVFISLNGPALIIKEVYHSFELVSFSDLVRWQIVYSELGIIKVTANLFAVGLRIALPIIGTLLLVSITMGLLGKAAPQMNLLMIGFPISISVGFMILSLLIPGIIYLISGYIDKVFADLWFLMVEINGG